MDDSERLERAIEDIRSDDTRTWTVVTGKPEGEDSNVHISAVDNPDGLDLQPPYVDFAVELIIEASKQSGTSLQDMLRIVVHRINNRGD